MKESVKNWITYIRKNGLPLDIDDAHRRSMRSIIRTLIMNDMTLASYFIALILIIELIAVVFLVISGNFAVAMLICFVIPMLLLELWSFWLRFSSRFGFSITIKVNPAAEDRRMKQ